MLKFIKNSIVTSLLMVALFQVSIFEYWHFHHNSKSTCNITNSSCKNAELDNYFKIILTSSGKDEIANCELCKSLNVLNLACFNKIESVLEFKPALLINIVHHDLYLFYSFNQILLRGPPSII